MALIMDVDAFWDRVGQDGDLAHELIEMFLKEYPKLYTEVRVAALAKDSAGVRRAGHAIKGMVANFSAERAVAAAALLEEMGRKEDLMNVAEACADLDLQLAHLGSALGNFEERAGV